MAEDTQSTISGLVAALAEGDRQALDAVVPLVYAEIHALAHRQRRQWRGDHTLNTTALVHEAYLKLAGSERLDVDSRAHFMALAATAMRQILVNYAKARRAQKRGGGIPPLTLSEQIAPAPAAYSDVAGADEPDVLVALDAALGQLEKVHSRQARVVECRFFGGMTIEETAIALTVSPRTVKRDWTVAQAWLHARMEGVA